MLIDSMDLGLVVAQMVLEREDDPNWQRDADKRFRNVRGRFKRSSRRFVKVTPNATDADLQGFTKGVLGELLAIEYLDSIGFLRPVKGKGGSKQPWGHHQVGFGQTGRRFETAGYVRRELGLHGDIDLVYRVQKSAPVGVNGSPTALLAEVKTGNVHMSQRQYWHLRSIARAYFLDHPDCEPYDVHPLIEMRFNGGPMIEQKCFENPDTGEVGYAIVIALPYEAELKAMAEKNVRDIKKEMID